MYTPPFKINSRGINLLAEISEQLGYCERELVPSPRLRKINRIRTIHGSLAIEGNTLSEAQITAIIDGKRVIAPEREIQEVRNAIKAYNKFSRYNPFSIKEMLAAHKLFMGDLIEDAGKFRQGNVGVIAGNEVIHVAPPAKRVNELMNALFAWLKKSDDHMLIKSSVFHYEFEFIHPFSDGNGRIGRLWQSLLLNQWRPLFSHIPIENMIYSAQQQYYDAIGKSTINSDSGIFTEFMLETILTAVIKYKKKTPRKNGGANGGANGGVNGGVNGGANETSEYTLEFILKIIARKPGIKTRQIIAMYPDCSQRTIERQLKTLRDEQKIIFVGATKNGGYFPV